MKAWRETEFYSFYFYNEKDGKIIGCVHRLGTQNVIYTAKIYNDIHERALGLYIDASHAKKAVELFWMMEENTLTYEQ